MQEAHEQWAYRQSGMEPMSAALVAVMVGMAAAAGASTGAAAGGTTTMAGSIAAGAVKAGVLALSSQVGVSFFNNNGDLGKVFKELGEKESIKNLAAAVITGGVLAGMGFNPLGEPSAGVGKAGIGDQLVNNLRIQGASTLINTTIQGGSFEDGLKNVLVNALINTLAASAANGIGDLSNGPDAVLNGLGNKLAHFMAGCAGGVLNAGNSGGCAAGGIGAAVGEMMAEAMGSGTKGLPAGWSDQNTVYLSGLFGGLAVALAGGDQEQVATGNWAGSNAAANNYLNHRQWTAFADEMSQCSAKATGCSDAERRTIRDRYQQLSAEQNAAACE